MKPGDLLRARLLVLFHEAARVAMAGEVEGALPVVLEPLDSALPGVWGTLIGASDEEALRQWVERAAVVTRPGGTVALISQVEPRGLRGTLNKLFSRRRAVGAETLCETLLLARFQDVRCEVLESGWALAWANAPGKQP